MKTLALAICLIGLSQSLFGQTSVRLCDLMKNTAEFRGKEVTVRATYRAGFEWSQLYCLDCNHKVWLNFSDDLDGASKRAARKASQTGIVNLTVTGVFEGPGEYGHLNGYKYQFTARKVRNVVVILRGMKGPKVERAAEERWACDGEHPK